MLELDTDGLRQACYLLDATREALLPARADPGAASQIPDLDAACSDFGAASCAGAVLQAEVLDGLAAGGFAAASAFEALETLLGR